MRIYKRRKLAAASRKDTAENFINTLAHSLENVDTIDSTLYPKYNVKRGLRNANGTGVVVGLTKIGEVTGYRKDGDKKIPCEGELYYRGYNIKELFQSYVDEDRFGFEEVTYLLNFGTLPTRKQLDMFTKLIGQNRDLPPDFARDAILNVPCRNIMNILARSVLTLYSYDEDPDNTSVANVIRQAINIIGSFPAIISYAYQMKRSTFDNESMHLHYPMPELSTAENILHMLRPTSEFTDMEAKLLDLCLVLQTEHGGGNNSSFTTHLISSSGTDTYSAVAAALGSLKGPKHGGANIAVIRMLQDLKQNVKDITDHKQVDEYLLKVLKGEANDGTGLVYGVGHAVYTLSDPRAMLLKDMAGKLAKKKGMEDTFQLCSYIEERTPELYAAVHGVEKPMPANVDLYSGIVYSALDIPLDVATPLFAMARLSGWCAHRIEELVAGRRLMRPAYVCVQDYRPYVPLKKR